MHRNYRPTDTFLFFVVGVVVLVALFVLFRPAPNRPEAPLTVPPRYGPVNPPAP